MTSAALRSRRLARALPWLALLLVAEIRVHADAIPPLPLEPGGPAAPGDWMLAQRGSGGGGIPAPHAAADAADRIARRTRAQAPAVAAAGWRLAGPTSVGGRVLDIAVDPERLNTVYVGAATGGVWKSVDAATTFTPAWPERMTQSIGALAIASDATLYAGTGEAGPGGGSLTYGGIGVYRSRDRGETWKPIGLATSSRIGRIAIDPKDPERLFVAATGNLFAPGGERGLYRSTNAGKSWKLVLPGANATTGAVDVVIDPLDPQRVWAAMWDHERTHDRRRYGGPGSGVYRSDDGGDSWRKLSGGLPASDAALGRIGLAVSPTVPDFVYAIAVGTDGRYRGFYSSRDGGETWSRSVGAMLLAQSQSTYGWWFGRVWVDPFIPTRVFAAGLQLLESVDAGTTWAPHATSQLSNPVHLDQHAMAWDPLVPGRIYLGNDGGVYHSVLDAAGGLIWVEALRQPFTQFYSVDVSEQDPARIVGGAQDNGSLRSYGRVAAEPANDGWNEYYGGDGEQTLISYADQNRVYACLQYGQCAYSTNGGTTMTSFTSRTVSTRRNWFTPLEFDPKEPSIMYYGGDVLNRSMDGGATWEPISPSLAPEGNIDGGYQFGTITTVAAARTDGNVLIVGTDDARIWTKRGTEPWRQSTDPVLPKRWVTRVAIDPGNADIMYATFSGYRNAEHAAHVFRSADGGATWSDISTDLPDAPVNDIVVLSDRLYVATDVGVFMTAEAGDGWLAVGSGLPLVPVTDLRFHAPSKTLYAATFGRGMYAVSNVPLVRGARIARPATGPLTKTEVTGEPARAGARLPLTEPAPGNEGRSARALDRPSSGTPGDAERSVPVAVALAMLAAVTGLLGTRMWARTSAL